MQTGLELDATTPLLAAVQRAAVRDEEGNLHIGRNALRQAMRDVSSDFHGLTGKLSCGKFAIALRGSRTSTTIRT